MNRVIVTNESMYDDDSLQSIKEMENLELIKAILEYSKNLEAMVLELRREVNDLTPPGDPKPYEDIHSDIYESFDDYPAYQKLREIFECE
ncbi:hypothetical protein [Desulfotomaculum sp. 1211_IL3151]|uniref:hypothetical protein n=1 Tax=Desulfotomaculum sp. 1211_IL3151 TaxID=3084055 RepID=UPI002FDA63F4